MELVLLKGPLEERWHEAIAHLYGPYNRKYADPGFCRRLFEGNPHGYSLHIFFVRPDGRAAGHYAVVPMEIVVDGTRRLSGKGEAFVVDAGYRRETVEVGGRDLLGAPAMQRVLLDQALAHGMEVVHMIAGREVALVHRMAGCVPLATTHRRSGLVLRAVEPDGDPPPRWRRALRRALVAGQRSASGFAGAASLSSARGMRRWSGADLDAGRLARVADELPGGPGWTVSSDPAALAWMARAGDLQLLAPDEAMTSWALICPRAGDGRSTEILAWRERAGQHAAVRLLNAVVAAARQAGSAFAGFSHSAAPIAAERERLRRAARLLVFREREQETGLLVRSERPEYRDPSRVRFNPFFYGIF